jgi:WhiB family redox-sensing transcriptional regulator
VSINAVKINESGAAVRPGLGSDVAEGTASVVTEDDLGDAVESVDGAGAVVELDSSQEEELESASGSDADSAPVVSPASVGAITRMARKNLQLDTSWQELANCLGVDPDLFFPERGASTREAKEVCRGCVVREDCLEFALANGEKFGIWGGMSERERRRIRRQRALERQGLLHVAAGGESA